MRILLFILTIAFAAELEVEGDLKVSGNIDAQNNPIKNVGIPQTLTDAINGNVLQDALRDDGPFEYKFVATKIDSDWLYSNNNDNGFQVSYKFIGAPHWIGEFEGYLTQLSNEGWEVYNISPYQDNSAGSFFWNQYVFRRSIE